jgi:hypothetical protein
VLPGTGGTRPAWTKCREKPTHPSASTGGSVSSTRGRSSKDGTMKAAVVHDFTPAAEHRERPQARGERRPGARPDRSLRPLPHRHPRRSWRMADLAPPAADPETRVALADLLAGAGPERLDDRHTSGLVNGYQHAGAGSENLARAASHGRSGTSSPGCASVRTYLPATPSSTFRRWGRPPGSEPVRRWESLCLIDPGRSCVRVPARSSFTRSSAPAACASQAASRVCRGRGALPFAA